MIRASLTIKNKLGIHTRAAAKLVDLAKRYQSHIELVFRDRVVDAKSIMSVITLGAQKNNVVEVVLDGEDEDEALMALNTLIDDKFGED
jgi:phosphocarrier protein HPr